MLLFAASYCFYTAAYSTVTKGVLLFLYQLAVAYNIVSSSVAVLNVKLCFIVAYCLPSILLGVAIRYLFLLYSYLQLLVVACDRV